MIQSTSSCQNTWWYLPPLVEFLRKSRKDNSSIEHSINISIILHTSTIVEGFIGQLLYEKLFYTDPFSNVYLIGEENLYKTLEKGQWEGLKNVYNKIYDAKISSDISPKTWKEIDHLFKLRNLLVHSFQLESIFESHDDNKKRFILHPKWEIIYKFLANERKIISKVDSSASYPSIKIITNKTADFFWEGSIDFIKQILEKRYEEVFTIDHCFDRAFKSIPQK